MSSSLLSRKRLAIGTAVAVVPAALLLNTSSATGSADTTLRLVERPGTFTFIDVPPMQANMEEPPTVGDGFALTQRVFRNGERIGTLVAKCTFVTVPANPDNGWLLCDGGYKLRRGTITGSVVTRAGSERTVIAITGGTGAYNGVGGTAIERPGPGNTTLVTIRLTR